MVTESQGVDFVNFIVMFENVDETASSIPDDSDWIVFRNRLANFQQNLPGMSLTLLCWCIFSWK